MIGLRTLYSGFKICNVKITWTNKKQFTLSKWVEVSWDLWCQYVVWYGNKLLGVEKPQAKEEPVGIVMCYMDPFNSSIVPASARYKGKVVGNVSSSDPKLNTCIIIEIFLSFYMDRRQKSPFFKIYHVKIMCKNKQQFTCQNASWFHEELQCQYVVWYGNELVGVEKFQAKGRTDWNCDMCYMYSYIFSTV